MIFYIMVPILQINSMSRNKFHLILNQIILNFIFLVSRLSLLSYLIINKLKTFDTTHKHHFITLMVDIQIYYYFSFFLICSFYSFYIIFFFMSCNGIAVEK